MTVGARFSRCIGFDSGELWNLINGKIIATLAAVGAKLYLMTNDRFKRLT